jgi:hypothetical protein
MTSRATLPRNFLREYGIISALAVIGYAARYFSGQFTPQFNIILFVLSYVFIAFSWEILRIINRALNSVLPFEKGIPIRIFIQLVIGIVLALSIRATIYIFGEPYLEQPLDRLFLVSTWLIYVLGVTIINGIFFTTYFINRWKDSIREAERLEKEKAIVQFDNLKNQMNPHFLFNALSSLNSLIGENQQLASDFLQQLSKIYRYILQNKDKGLVSLQTELDFIRNYILLVETRFQNSLKIEFDIPASIPDKSIVPVTLQVLIENAMKHNRIDEQFPLRIEIKITNDDLWVSNNLQPRKTVDSNKQGLENLKSLYQFFSERPVVIEQTDKQFSIRVPLI